MLTLLYYQLTAGDTSLSKFCTFGEKISCEAVAASRFSTLLGIPIAVYGIATYTLTFILGLLGFFGGERQKTRVATYLFFIAAWCALYSFFLAGVSFFYIHATCLFCDLLYLTSAILLFVTWRLSGRSVAGDISFVWSDVLLLWQRKGIFACVVLAFVLAASVVSYRYVTYRQSPPVLPGEILEYIEKYERFPTYQVPLRNSPRKGNRGAKVTIIEFSDFQSPFCRRAHETVSAMVKKYKGKIRAVWKNYPLDHQCNPTINRPFHRFACLAAAASHCADKEGVFWEYSEILFEHQKNLNPRNLSKYAEWLRLDQEEFSQCIQQKSTHKVIVQDVLDGMQLGIESTPTFFINGRKVKGAISPELFEAIIEHELAH